MYKLLLGPQPLLLAITMAILMSIYKKKDQLCDDYMIKTLYIILVIIVDQKGTSMAYK